MVARGGAGGDEGEVVTDVAVHVAARATTSCISMSPPTATCTRSRPTTAGKPAGAAALPFTSGVLAESTPSKAEGDRGHGALPARQPDGRGGGQRAQQEVDFAEQAYQRQQALLQPATGPPSGRSRRRSSGSTRRTEQPGRRTDRAGLPAHRRPARRHGRQAQRHGGPVGRRRYGAGEIVDLNRLVVAADVPSRRGERTAGPASAVLVGTGQRPDTRRGVRRGQGRRSPATGTYRVWSRSPADRDFMPGHFTDIRIVAVEHRDVLVVPEVALVTRAGRRELGHGGPGRLGGPHPGDRRAPRRRAGGGFRRGDREGHVHRDRRGLQPARATPRSRSPGAEMIGRFATRHSLSIVFICARALPGVASTRPSTLASSVFPRTDFPRVVILVDNGVMPGDEMMARITRPIEEAMKDIRGVTTVKSATGRGSAEINVFFTWNVDMVQSELYVLSRLSQIRSTLPPTAQATVYRLTFAAFPIIGVSLTSDTRDITELWETARYNLKLRFLRIPGRGARRPGRRTGARIPRGGRPAPPRRRAPEPRRRHRGPERQQPRGPGRDARGEPHPLPDRGRRAGPLDPRHRELRRRLGGRPPGSGPGLRHAWSGARSRCSTW